MNIFKITLTAIGTILVSFSTLADSSSTKVTKSTDGAYVTYEQAETVDTYQYYVSGQKYEKTGSATFTSVINARADFKCKKISGNSTFALTINATDTVFLGSSFTSVVGSNAVIQSLGSGCYDINDNQIETSKLLSTDVNGVSSFLVTRIRFRDLDGKKVITQVEVMKRTNSLVYAYLEFKTKAYMKTTPPNAFDVLKQDPRFSTFVKLSEKADLDFKMSAENRTILAPTNAAFEKISKDALENLLQPDSKSQLQEVLLNHVIQGINDSAKVLALAEQDEYVFAFSGRDLKFSLQGKDVFVKNIFNSTFKIGQTDIPANKAVIHALDDVITKL